VERTTIRRHRCFLILRADRAATVAGTLESHAGCHQLTLRAPIQGGAQGEREILGFAWDITHDGFASRYLRVLLLSQDAPYVSTKKTSRLGCLAYTGNYPDGAFIFQSKIADRDQNFRAVRVAGIPAHAEDSKKNFVIMDRHKTVVFKIFKISRGACLVQAVPFFGMLVTFAIALAIVVR
jgi:hypothetical protein